MILLNGKLINFTQFPNGETKLNEESVQAAIESYNTVSFKYENDGDLIKLMFLKKYLDSCTIEGFMGVDLKVYYMPYSRMDRSENGSAFTLKYVTQFINDLMFNQVILIEPHSDVTPALIDGAESILVNEQLITIVMNEVQFDLAEDYLVYPDAGAQKRYAKFFDGNVVVAHKERDFQTGYIKKLDLIGAPYPKEKRKAIIVDDLCSKGGTFILTAQALKDAGFDEIYLLVAHCENTIFEGDILKGNLIKKVFTTNTIISSTQNGWDDDYKDKLEILEIEELA